MADDNQDIANQGSAPLVNTAQQAVIAINGLTNAVRETFPNWVTAPANSTASGVAGQVAYSGNGNTTSYFYVCFVGGAAGTARWGRFTATTGF